MSGAGLRIEVVGSSFSSQGFRVLVFRLRVWGLGLAGEASVMLAVPALACIARRMR